MILLYIVKITGTPFFAPFFKLKIAGRKNMGFSGPAIVIHNHIGHWDAVVLDYALFDKTLHFMTADRVFEINPFISWFMKRMGCFPIGGSGNAFERSLEILSQGKILYISPEGRIVKDAQPGRFRTGAARIALESGAPVIPCYLHNRPGLFRRTRIAVGEPVDLRAYWGERPYSYDDLVSLSELLRSRVMELSENFK